MKMKQIKIKINQLGRVQDSVIQVSPFMVFSGESGLGKSYVALLCHYFFELMVDDKRLNHYFVDNDIDFNAISKSFEDSGEALSISKKDLELWMAKDAVHYIQYMLGYDDINGDIEVSLPESFPHLLTFTYKKELTGLVDAEDIYTILTLGNLSYRIQEKTPFDESPFSFLLRFVMVDYIFGNYQKLASTFILPPSRGPVLTEQIIPTTGMYNKFLSDLTWLNRIKQRPDTASETVLRLFNKILEGDVNKEENAYVYTTDSVSMPVSAAAASIREIAPLQILAKKQSISKCAILIEEPEAHLHPLKQRMMADIIGALSHDGAVMQITTHSDYFLRRLNELIMFAEACKKVSDTERIDILSKKVNIVEGIAIDATYVEAYLLQKQQNGFSKAIRQDLSKGVPFSAFIDAIKQNIGNQDYLEEFLQDGVE